MHEEYKNAEEIINLGSKLKVALRKNSNSAYSLSDNI